MRRLARNSRHRRFTCVSTPAGAGAGAGTGADGGAAAVFSARRSLVRDDPREGCGMLSSKGLNETGGRGTHARCTGAYFKRDFDI